MGARNSIPQTAQIVNPTNADSNYLTVTEEVSNRLHNVIKQQNQSKDSENFQESYVCKNCKCENFSKENSQQLLQSKIQSKPQEIEKENFEEAYTRADETLKKPINWSDKHKIQLQELESNLLKCYQQYKGEPLHCYNTAKNYQKFVFEKQYETILRHAQAGEGGGGDKDFSDKESST